MQSWKSPAQRALTTRNDAAIVAGLEAGEVMLEEMKRMDVRWFREESKRKDLV